MKDTIIGRQIRRCNRNLLLVNLAVIALLILALIGNQRYLYNCIAGPFPISVDQLQDVRFGTNKEFFIITDLAQPNDTGAYIAHKRDGKEESRDRFFAANTGERSLIVESSATTVSSPYQGVFYSVPADIRSLLDTELKKEGSEFNQRFIPYMLSMTNYRLEAYMSFAIGVVLIAFCLYNVKNALLRMEDPKHSPVYHAVARYGNNVGEIATAVDAEATSGNAKKYGSFTLTKSWLLHQTFFTFTPFHLYDIIWIYQKQTQHYYWFIIPTGKSHSIIISDMIGRTAESDLGRGKSQERSSGEFIAELRTKMPWVVAWYSQDLENLYKKQLPEFVADVAESRRQYEESVVSNAPPELH